MTFHWPQIIIIALCAMEFGISLAMHGKSRGLHSAWFKSFDIAVLVWLLYEGGFFGVVA
jgi:hypothetical protein